MKSRYLLIPLVLACFLNPGSALAQSARGDLQATVVDQSDDPLPGVTVVVSSPVLQGVRTAVTDEHGKVRFSLLPPGIYSAVFTLDNYQTVEQDNVRVALEATATLEVSMNAVYTEEVLVTSEAPVVDVTATAIGSDFGQELMPVLPTGRDFTSITFLASGAVDGGAYADDRLQGNPSIMGASALENRYVVDELDTTDVAEGRAGTLVSYNFIEEIHVKTGGYQAEYGGALGGVINMITKSGGNDLKADVFVNYSDDSLWDEANVPQTRGEVKTVDSEYDFGFTLGGKFIEDKLWYFVAYNPNRTDQLVRNDVFLGDDVFQSNRLIREWSRDFYTGKLTWQVSDNSSVVANILGDPSEAAGDYYSTNFIDSPFVAETDMTYDRKIGGMNLGLSSHTIFTADTYFEAKLGHHESREEYTPNLDTPNYQDQTAAGLWTEGVGGDVLFGGSGFQQPKDDRTRDQLRASFSWFLGDDHEIKIGGGLNDVEYDMDYNVAGPSAAFCAPAIEGGAMRYDPETGDAVVIPNNCSTLGNGVLDGVMMPARVGNRFRLRDGYYYNRNYKNQSTGTTEEYNLYLQDAWKITDNLTLQLGLRAESSKSEGNLTQQLADRTLDFALDDMIAPRVGLVWDVAKSGRSKVFGHYGKFYQSIPLTINVRAFGNENYDFYYYEYPESGLPSTENPGLLTYWYRFSSEFTRIDPDIKPQYLEEYVLGGEYEVAKNVAVGVKYIRRELGRVIEDISVDGGNTYFITNPGGTYTVNPATGVPLDEPAFFPEAVRDFDGVELSGEKRLSNNWQMRASLMWSDLEGNYEGLYSRDNQQIDPNITSKFDLPSLLNNAFGTLQNNREWQFKTYGSYHFDFGMTAGFNFFYLTGNPVSKLGAHRTYGLDERFVTPRGSEGTTPDWWNLDLHLGYPIAVGNSRLELALDVFNVFDEQPAIELDQRWTVNADTDPDPDVQTNVDWGEPLVYPFPRNIRVGLKFSW